MPSAATNEPLLLTGMPRARGQAHGETLRDLIRQHVAAWEEEVGRETALPLRSYVDRFERETRFLPALQRETPDLLDEVHGIAEGARLAPAVCRCLQCLDQHWHHLDRVGQQRQPASGCSCLGAGPGRRGTIIGQNMDLPDHSDGFQVLLRIRLSAGVELLVPSLAGVIGLFGVSSRGLGLCVNTISQLRASPAGLPVGFVIRSTLQQRSFGDAAAHLQRLPHASGQNYLLGSPDELLDLECSATGAVAWRPGEALLCHTNHPLASRDLDPDKVGWDADREQADLAHGLTFTRFEALQRGLASAAGLDVDRARQLLAAVAHLPRGRFGVTTTASAIFELRPGRPPRAHVASGPPGTPWQTFAFG